MAKFRRSGIGGILDDLSNIFPRNGKGREYYGNGILRYEGEYVNDRWEGQGILYWEDGRHRRYEGSFAGGKMTGKGKMYDKRGVLLYEGDVVNGCREGQGTHYREDGSRWYEGGFAKGEWNGKGREYDKSGALEYEGNFVNGRREGQGTWYGEDGSPHACNFKGGMLINGYFRNEGTYYWKDGTRYIGSLADGKPNGRGREYYKSGALRYEGDWVNGCWEGQGTWYGEDGSRYEGNFAGGKRTGKGKMYNKRGALLYKGDWVNGGAEGQGTLYREDGSRCYQGCFAGDKANGKGREYYKSGALRYEGDCVNGRWEGQGTLYREDGTVLHKGTFTGGELIGPSLQSPIPANPPAGKPAPPPQPSALPDADSDKYIRELKAMIGLAEVKENVGSLVNLIRARKERESRNLPVSPMSYHMAFTGNPGTGKTTVARLIGKIYHSLGIIQKPDVVETDRAGLVEGYIGQTALKTEKIIQQARGGILFIDEAYSLIPEDSARDFGPEAIDCLLKRMEDYRDELIVIAAGYEKPMERFLNSNDGLQSRFTHHIHFDDYTPPELVRILELNCAKGGFRLDPMVQPLFERLMNEKLKSPEFREKFSNGRYVRNLFERLIYAQSDRLSRTGALHSLDTSTLMTITAADLRAVVSSKEFERIY